jgi:hypothetical protein
VNNFFTKTFFRFLFGFAAIIAVAFLVLIVASYNQPKAVDTVAHPQ